MKLFRISLTIITILFILLAIIGHIVRDLTVELALLMYIPLLPLGLWAIFWDLLQKGYSLPLRFTLTCMGLGIIIWGTISMMGVGGTQINSKIGNKISVLHWNVRWGGSNWQSISTDIKQKNPDIIIINEIPSKIKLNQLLKQLGNQWSMITYQDILAVYSSWPLQLESHVKIKNIDAIQVVITLYEQPLRILAIDAGRNMSSRLTIMSKEILPRWRTPMLMDLTKTIVKYHNKGQPIDIIAGDFNALSISLGFDDFKHMAGGYNLAAKFSNDWRGTWKSYLPLYDLDHVWVHKRFQGLETELFTNFATDHRGQIVKFNLNSIPTN
jgi:endonuclease/exonuclease/phosphatase (EEP) superfamily protein YafD